MSAQTARAAAADYVRNLLGLPASPQLWTQAQRVQFDHQLAQYVADNPTEFTAADVQTAKHVSSEDPQAAQLVDNTFAADVSTFSDQFLKEANTMANAGGTLLQKAVLVAVVVAVSWYMVPMVFEKLLRHGIEQPPSGRSPFRVTKSATIVRNK